MFELIAKQLLKNKRRKKARRRLQPRRMNDSFTDLLLGATKPGGTKMQFPYEIPTITTDVEFTDAATSTIYGGAIILATGLAVNGLANLAAARTNKR